MTRFWWIIGCCVVAAIAACGEDGTLTTATAGMSGGSTGAPTTGTETTGSTSDTPTTGTPTTGGTAEDSTGTTSPTTGTSASTTSTTGDPTTTTTTTTGVMTGTTTMMAGECGDGVVDDGEACDDGNDIDDDACNNQCQLASCGDGVLQTRSGEACEGDELGGETCESLGFDGGTLACLDTCMHDISGCAACGDGDLDPGETCDDGNTDPGDGCDATCQLEACDPDGVYAVQGAPIAYTCCNGLVNLTINGFTLSSDGASIASSPANPVTMTGAPTMCPDGDFMNSGELAGGCTETYSVSGSFTDANTWEGTYTLGFVGQDCSCFNGMFGTPCVDQNFPVTAQR